MRAASPRPPPAPERVCDIAFRVAGTDLPVDHAQALAAAVVAVLPWLGEHPGSGVHPLHGAASGNGWQRPGAGERIALARRTRLLVRVPAEREAAAGRLAGRTLDVGGATLTVGEGRRRELQPSATLFARRVVAAQGDDEAAFLAQVETQLEALALGPRRLVCGLAGAVETHSARLATRSLLVADLGPEPSRRLLAAGIGDARLLGCGMFVPHKSIAPV